MSSNLWSRLREARLGRVLLVYAGAAWAVLEATGFFIAEFGLPPWFLPAALILLVIGLVVLVGTAWVQSSPRAARVDDVAGPWEVDLIDLKDSVARGRLPRLTWARAILGGVFAFSLLFGFAGVYVLLTQRSTTTEAAPTTNAGPAIAVLPFRVVGPDAELWREGMVDLFYNNLDGVAGLRAINPRTVLSSWRAAAGAAAQEPDDPLSVARALGASYALVGNMVGSESGVRITTEVHELAGGEVQRVQVEGSPDSVIPLVDRLCLEMLRSGVISVSGELPQLDLSRVTTASLPALKAYLEGERKYRRSRFRESIADFERAVEADSTFALALHRISQAYGWLDPFSERTSDYARRATRYADRLPRREALLLRADEAMARFRLDAIEMGQELANRFPDDAEVWRNLGEVSLHVGDQALHPRDRIRTAFEKAVELDPGFGPSYIHLVDHALIHEDSSEGLRLIARHRSIDPNSPHARGLSLVSALAWGDSAARATAIAALDTTGGDALFTAWARFAWSSSRFSEALGRVSTAFLDTRHPERARYFGVYGASLSHVLRGRYREAYATIDRGAPLVSEDGRRDLAFLDLMLHLTGGPDAERARRGAEILGQSPRPVDLFWLGALATREERWADVDEQLRVLESLTSSDSTELTAFDAGDVRALTQALRGHREAYRKQYRSAARLLEEALPGLPVDVNGFVRYELGRLWLELGDPEKAERFLKSLELYTQSRVWVTSTVEYSLGQTYEALGSDDEARRHYARFVGLWEGADPELREWWERGRAALERLTAEASR